MAEELTQKLQQADAHLSAGRIDAARALCAEVLQQAPDHAAAHHLAGMIANASGDLNGAIDELREATRLNPAHPVFPFNLAILERQAKRSVDAATSFAEAIRRKPDFAEAHNMLGLVMKETGNWLAAEASYQQAIASNSNFVDALVNLADLYCQQGRWTDAQIASERALAIQPNSVEAIFNRAVARKNQGDLAEAIADYRRAIELRPSFALAHNNLGNALFACGQYDEAIGIYEEALRRQPNYLDARFNLATVLFETGAIARAIDEYERVIAQSPSYAAAYGNLASALRHSGRYEEAVERYRQAIALEPNVAENYFSLGNVYSFLDKVDEAADAYRSASALKPHRWLWRLRQAILCPVVFPSKTAIDEYRQQLQRQLAPFRELTAPIDLAEVATSGCEPSFNWQYHGRNDRQLKEDYAAIFAGKFPTIPGAIGAGLPRVGFVVTDRQEPLFARQMTESIRRFRLDRFRLTIICSEGGRRYLEPKLRREGVDFLAMPADFGQTVECLRAGNFAVLYFREIGTDATNYFLPFCRLAPIQCTTWGVQVTSGIPEMDYYLSSRWFEPDNAQEHYTEKLVQFDTLLTHQVPRPVPVPPARKEEFGGREGEHLYVCAQQIGKFHPDFDPVIGAILERDPLGRLAITAGKSLIPARQLHARFQTTIPEVVERIIFLPKLDQDTYLRLVFAADVILDPLYYGGVNTTYDGLSAGVPIVTCPSNFHIGRYTLGCYRKMGVLDCVAESNEQYVDIAVRLGTDREYREHIRQKILAARPNIFEDAAVAPELEEWFCRVIEAKRQL